MTPIEAGRPGPQKVDILDPQGIIREVQENGYYVLPAGNRLHLTVQCSNGISVPPKYYDLGIVAIDEPLDVVVTSTFTGDHDHITSAQNYYGYGVSFGPHSEILMRVRNRVKEGQGNKLWENLYAKEETFLTQSFLNQQPYAVLARDKGVDIGTARRFKLATKFPIGTILNENQVDKMLGKIRT